MTKTDQEWKKQLSDEQFHVTRKKGTEPAFTGKYWDMHEVGVYRCVCCNAELFRSDTKFESGTGWPSFFDPISTDSVPHRSIRHLAWHASGRGHVRAAATPISAIFFRTASRPTGQRYCMNSASLDFKKKD